MTKTIAQLFADNPITSPTAGALFEISEGGTSGGIANSNIGPLRLVGSALIGPSFSGNARGANAFDLQTNHTSVAMVASGSKAVTIGADNTASGNYAVAIGYNNSALSNQSFALGSGAKANGTNSLAIGYKPNVNSNVTNNGIAIGNQAYCGGNKSMAIGYKAYAYFGAVNATAIGYRAYVGASNCVALGGPIIIPSPFTAPALGIQEIQRLSGAVVVITTAKRNLKVTFDETVTFPSTPNQTYFYVNQVGVWATNVTAMTVQPTVRFGIVGTLAKYLAAVITTHLTAANIRELYSPIVNNDGEVNVTAGVTVGASATTFNGRFFWIGMLVQADVSSAQ